ncbi:MAG: cell wall-binding repeat-containing protein [Oscillospiraceae bacterium]|nr:cell wall-binding repeat-containing protein [Oscillospiraceae bacterium]
MKKLILIILIAALLFTGIPFAQVTAAVGGVFPINNINEDLGNLSLHKIGVDKDSMTIVSNGSYNQATYGTKSIQGAVFLVYAAEDIVSYGTDGFLHKRAFNGDQVATVTTDSNGNASVVTAQYYDDEGVKADVNGLLYGRYRIAETTAPFGYKLDPRTFHITVSASTPIPTVTTNETASYPHTSEEPFDAIPWGDVELTKHDITDMAAIPGAVIELYTAGNILLGEFTTDAQGKVKIVNLPVDRYYFIEKSAPAGSNYLINPDKLFFTITDDGNDTPNMAEEPLKVGSLNLVKEGHSTNSNDISIDANGNAANTAITLVANAVFELRAAEDIYTRKYSGTDTGAILRARVGDLIATLTTNSNGQSTVTNARFMNEAGTWDTGLNFLYYGKYTVTEISAPSAYVIDSMPITVTVSATTPNPAVQHTINNVYSGDKNPFNRIKTCNVRLIIIDARTKLPLAGAVIGIYSADGTLKQTFTAPTNGEIDIVGLPYGGYYFQELTPPYGYLINSERIEFDVNTDGGLIDLKLSNKAPAAIARFSGNNRVETSVDIADKGWFKTDTVVLASGANFADALAASSLAKQCDAPILLTTSKTTLEANVVSTINALNAKNVVIVGGASSVSEDIYEQLEGFSLNVERLAGGNRYQTAIEIAKSLKANGADFTEVFLADGTNFPDALSVSPVAGILAQPILFTNKADVKNINTDTGDYIKSAGITTVNVIGGGISDAVIDSLKASYEVANTKRLSGANRYATAVAINSEYKSIFTGYDITLTTGANFPDALAGSAYAARIGAPLFLLQNGQTLDYVKEAIQGLDAVNIYIFGGENSLDNDTVKNHI